MRSACSNFLLFKRQGVQQFRESPFRQSSSPLDFVNTQPFLNAKSDGFQLDFLKNLFSHISTALIQCASHGCRKPISVIITDAKRGDKRGFIGQTSEVFKRHTACGDKP